jgi:hypothetical protein
VPANPSWSIINSFRAGLRDDPTGQEEVSVEASLSWKQGRNLFGKTWVENWKAFDPRSFTLRKIRLSHWNAIPAHAEELGEGRSASTGTSTSIF